jgi:hypothetical protein
MTCSKVLHAVAVLAWALGAASLIAAWVAGADGTVLNFTQEHLFNDANGLLLLSIASGIGTMHHTMKGKKK